MPPSFTQLLCSRKGAFEQVAQPGPKPRKVRAEPAGAARSCPSPRINCSGLAPLSDRNRITVSRSAPMAASCRITLPISRSMRVIMAAWMAILVRWNAFCSAVSVDHGTARATSPGPVLAKSSSSGVFPSRPHPRLARRQRVAVLREVAVLIQHGVGVIEAHAARAGDEPHGPLARMIRAVAQRLEVIRDESRVTGHVARGHDIAGRLLRVVAGKQTAP